MTTADGRSKCEKWTNEQRPLTVHAFFEALQQDANYLKSGLTVKNVSKLQFRNQKVPASEQKIQ